MIIICYHTLYIFFWKLKGRYRQIWNDFGIKHAPVFYSPYIIFQECLAHLFQQLPNKQDFVNSFIFGISSSTFRCNDHDIWHLHLIYILFSWENTEQAQTTIKNNMSWHIPNINFVRKVQNASIYKMQDDTHFCMAYAGKKKKKRKKIQIKPCPE